MPLAPPKSKRYRLAHFDVQQSNVSFLMYSIKSCYQYIKSITKSGFIKPVDMLYANASSAHTL